MVLSRERRRFSRHKDQDEQEWEEERTEGEKNGQAEWVKTVGRETVRRLPDDLFVELMHFLCPN